MILRIIQTEAPINLYFTDIKTVVGNNSALQHNCFYITPQSYSYSGTYYTSIDYCMSELSSNFQISKIDSVINFTFSELAQQNITSEQLYLASAPIDVIENYQDYLNRNDSSLSESIFYICTWPRFGQQCQYELDFSSKDFSDIHDYAYQNPERFDDSRNQWSCYIHLMCNRSPGMRCLDWTDICDGKVDCLNSGVDEENCWQLEINDCQQDEYKCYNGICLFKEFVTETRKAKWNCLRGNKKYPAISSEDNDCKLSTQYEPYCDQSTCFETFLTSSCLKTDRVLMELFSIKQENISDTCWFAVQCLARLHEECVFSSNLTEYVSMIEVHCPDFMFIPSVPILFDDIYFVYIKNQSRNVLHHTYLYFYLCSKNSFYESYFSNEKKFIFNDLICYRNISWQFDQVDSHLKEIFKYEYGSIHGYNSFAKYSSEICQRSNMYQCQNSPKCISLNRLNDGIDDCMYADDEDETRLEKENLTEYFKQSHYQCSTSKKYIPEWTINDGICQCGVEEHLKCEDEPSDDFQLELSFFTIGNICDGFIDSKSILIDGQILTDETECENWPCDNYFTHCNQVWNCLDGKDELDCQLFSSINCSSNEHTCKSKDDGHLICLPLEKVNDGISDCHGNIDESKVFKRNMPSAAYASFQCQNASINRCIYPFEICDKINNCPDGDDEQFCYVNFDTYQHVQYQLSDSQLLASNEFHCNQGFSLLVWLNKEKNLFQRVCFCPIHFYGNQCQYQNQQVNLYMKFQALYSSSYSIFQIVVLLVDDSNEQIIHSYKQLTFVKEVYIQCAEPEYYLASLIYSIRPKDMLKNDSIHIHIYEKISLSYRASFLIPIEYSFLPVHRLAKLISIPRNNRSIRYCSDRQCNSHGKCLLFFNQTKEKFFCQCQRGWTGKFCSISYDCSCSSHSLCLGISAINRSVCVCPVNLTGPRCLIKDLSCQMDQIHRCENGGQCIGHQDSFHGVYRQVSCVCREGFSGASCGNTDYNLTLSFEKEMILSTTLHIHMFRRLDHHVSYRTILPITISKNKNFSVIYWRYEYHLVIVQTFSPDHYYFAGMTRENEIPSSLIKRINSSDRCLHLNEFLPETIYNLDHLRRVKYYYMICERYSSNLSCFYDNDNFCKCDYFNEKSYPYCFSYQHNPALPQLDQIECYSGGERFQDDIQCPSRLWCVCPRCSFGTQCQFTTSGFGLSIDSILSFHIQPHVNLSNQPALVQVTAGLCIVFLIIGFVNGLLSLITFKNKIVCEVGCGLYLLCSSINTLLTTMFFGFKVWILLLSQMSVIKNETFLTAQCYSIDFLVRACLSMDQWLNACVAVERAVCSIQAVTFNKNKSKRIAKVMIIVVVIFNIGISIHDPIYRQLIYEENSYEENDDIARLWCIINYKAISLSTYNNIIHTFHFFCPFLVNLLSAIILIRKKTYQRANVQINRTFFDIFREQFQQHKRLLIAPIVLVLLAIPRLIITYSTKCMESEDDAWLYLIAYFMSFISPMLTFIIYIAPSKFYMKEFQDAIQRLRRRIQRR